MHKLILLFSLIFLVSCTSAPKPSNYPLSSQKKMESAHHWEVLAQEVVENQVVPSITLSEFESGHVMPSMDINSDYYANKVYVDTSDYTLFGQAFYTYLSTELTNHGILISDTSKDATTIKWGTQLVQHDKSRGCSGIIVWTVGLVSKTLLGTDFLSSPSDIELIITTVVSESNHTLSRKTYTYYLDESNTENFSRSKGLSAKYNF